jgi:hypothetical protein
MRFWGISTEQDGLKSLLAIAGVVGIATVVFGKK